MSIPLPRALDELRAAEVAGRAARHRPSAWASCSSARPAAALLGFADRGQEQIEPLAIVAADLAVDRFDLVADVVEDALAVLDALQLARFFFGRCRR